MNKLLPIARMIIIIFLQYINRKALSHDSINKGLKNIFKTIQQWVDKEIDEVYP